MILIDNYDSFTYNVVQYLKELGVKPNVFKNDEIGIEELKEMNFSSIVISPGPKNPDESGISMDVINEFYKTKKILGICLGHQCIAQYFGASIVKGEPVHGKVSKVFFEEENGGFFEGIEQGFEATRYHSLIVDNQSLPECLVPLAYANAKWKMENESIHHSPFTIHSSTIMAIKHKNYPIYGVQFHPEAILTQGGKKLLKNFLNILSM